MKKDSILTEIAERRIGRRRILRDIGIAGIGAAAGGALVACGGNATPSSVAAQSAAPTDTDILNFALNLEYLEAEFYTVATTGKTIDQIGIGISGTGTQGAATGGHQVSFSDPALAAVAAEIAMDEQEHVSLLRTALGANAVAQPAINLAALGVGFGSDAEFLTLARAFEDVGVSAYGGAAPLITDKSILGTAARILATEALHSGNIRLQVAQKGIAVKAVDSTDVLPPPAGSQYFEVDNNGLAIIRTPRQVLDIVYASPGASSGGFFPNGFNGNIH